MTNYWDNIADQHPLVLAYAGPLTQWLHGVLKQGDLGPYTWSGVAKTIFTDAFRSDWLGDLTTLPHKCVRLDNTEFRLIRSRRMYQHALDVFCYGKMLEGIPLSSEVKFYPDQKTEPSSFKITPNMAAPMENLWLDVLAPLLTAPKTLATAAALGGHARLLQYLVREKGVDIAHMPNFMNTGRHYIMDAVASNGHVEVLGVLRDLKCTGISRTALKGAFRNSHADAIMFLLQHYPRLRLPSKATFYAARDGHLGVLQFLIQKRHAPCPPAVMDIAAYKGHDGIVTFLHEIGKGCSTNAMDAAACAGRLDMVKFLHFNRSEGCTTLAFDAAAFNNDRRLLDFLIEHRSEGGSTMAMDGAAFEGHEAMVRFLHAHRTEGCTTRAVDFAANRGNLSLVQFLLSARSEGFTYSGMVFAADCNHTEVLAYLLAHDTTKAKAVQAMKKVLLNDDDYFRTSVLPKFKRAGFPRTHDIAVDYIQDDNVVAAAVALYDSDEAADDSGYESDEFCMFHRIYRPIREK